MSNFLEQFLTGMSNVNNVTNAGTTAAGNAAGVKGQSSLNISQIVLGWFNGKGSKTDYKGWDDQDKSNGYKKGRSAYWWACTNGDNEKNECINVLSYISEDKDALFNMATVAQDDFNQTVPQFLQIFKDKLVRNGFQNEAETLINQTKTVDTNIGTTFDFFTNLFNIGGSINPNANNASNTNSTASNTQTVYSPGSNLLKPIFQILGVYIVYRLIKKYL